MVDANYQDLYSSDSYATRYEPEKGFYQPDDRTFHQPGFFYDSAAQITGVNAQLDGFEARVVLDSGEPAGLRVKAISRGTLRLQFWQGETVFQDTSPMVPALPADIPPVHFQNSDQAIEMSWEQYRLQLGKAPFNLQVFNPQGKVIFRLDTERIAGQYVSAPLGFRKKGSRESQPYLSWSIEGPERYFGFGEKWNKVEKTSTRATIWSADTGGSNTTLLSYKSVPVLYCTAGWGLMLHSSYRSHWDVGTFSYTSGSVLTEEPRLDLFLFFDPGLKGLIERYTALTGRPALPPKWAMGVWMSRCAYPTAHYVEEIADRIRQEGIPCDVLHLDPAWMKNHYYPLIGVDACDFDWDYNTFPEKEPFFARLKARGFDASLWINPYLPEGQPIYEEALQKGYLVGSVNGGISRLEFNEPVGIVDLTHSEARAWWKEHLKKLLRWGGSVLKCDYGDRVPETARFANGKTGREMHNLFLHLYNEVAFEAREEVYGKGQGVVWRRAGYIGSQRFPGTWAGDTQVTWQGMRGALRGGLSAGFNADVFWSHDIGGFVGDQPSPELYIRWAQFGLLSPFARFHGTTPREPWQYGETALQVIRHYATLRYSLIPYLQALGYEAQANGTPLLRHLKLEFPAEMGVEWIDDQYLLGPDLLIAPILEEGARSRQVYFPAGRWTALENPAMVLDGPGYHEVIAPLENMPVFVRAGAVLPRYIEIPQHLKGPAAQQLALEIYPGDSQRSLTLEEGGPITLDYTFSGAQGILKVSSAQPGFVIHLVGWQAEASVEGQPLVPEKSPQGDQFILPARFNQTIQLRHYV